MSQLNDLFLPRAFSVAAQYKCAYVRASGHRVVRQGDTHGAESNAWQCLLQQIFMTHEACQTLVAEEILESKPYSITIQTKTEKWGVKDKILSTPHSQFFITYG